MQAVWYERNGPAREVRVRVHASGVGVVMSGWRPFGNVIVDDVWAWRGGCCWCGRPPYGIAVPE